MKTDKSESAEESSTTARQQSILHTPGPYFVRREKDGCDDCYDIVAAGDDRAIVSVRFWDDVPEWAARAEANARLFAAAPDLLEALRTVDAYLAANEATDYTATERRRLVLAAIAKAERGDEDDVLAENRSSGTCSFENEKDMNTWTPMIQTVEELLRDPPVMPSDVRESLRKVLNYVMAEERIDYEGTLDQDREGHIFRDLHRLDCWLSEYEPWEYEYPVELKGLGDISVTPDVLRHVSHDELSRLLREHRMERWGTRIDASAGEFARHERDAIHYHDGVLESIPEIHDIELSIQTRFTTTTTVSVVQNRFGRPKAKPKR